MKFLILASALFFGAHVHAQRYIEFRCDGNPHGYNVTVSGTLQVYGQGNSAQYEMYGPLTVTGDDLRGAATESDGSDEMGERHFDDSQVTVERRGGELLIEAKSEHSSIVITHQEGTRFQNLVDINMARTYQPPRPPYRKMFQASCGW